MKTEFCYPLNFNWFAHKTHLVFLFFSLSLSLTDKNKLNFNINFNVFYFKSRFNIVNIFEARQKKKKVLFLIRALSLLFLIYVDIELSFLPKVTFVPT